MSLSGAGSNEGFKETEQRLKDKYKKTTDRFSTILVPLVPLLTIALYVGEHRYHNIRKGVSSPVASLHFKAGETLKKLQWEIRGVENDILSYQAPPIESLEFYVPKLDVSFEEYKKQRLEQKSLLEKMVTSVEEGITKIESSPEYASYSYHKQRSDRFFNMGLFHMILLTGGAILGYLGLCNRAKRNLEEGMQLVEGYRPEQR